MKLLFTILFSIIIIGDALTQCLNKDNESSMKKEIAKRIGTSSYDNLNDGEQVKIDYLTKDENGDPDDQGTVLILKRNNKLEFYQVGIWIKYDNGKILGKYYFDECGFRKHEEFFQNLDTIKTSEVIREQITYKGKKYVRVVIQNYDKDIETYDSFLIVNGKRKHHGLSRTIRNGVVTYETEYEFGKKK